MSHRPESPPKQRITWGSRWAHVECTRLIPSFFLACIVSLLSCSIQWCHDDHHNTSKPSLPQCTTTAVRAKEKEKIKTGGGRRSGIAGDEIVVNHQQKVVRDGAIGVRCIAFKTVRQSVPFVICVVGFCRWSLNYACMYSCTHYNIPVFISFHIVCYLLATRFPAQRTLFLFSQLDNPMGSQIGMNVLPT